MVTSSEPDAAMALDIICAEANLPVPVKSREPNRRPAIISGVVLD
jgi:hypothetical protein